MGAAGTEGVLCAVCREPLAGAGMGFGCDVGHLLHPACLAGLLRHRPDAPCPVCRRDGGGSVYQLKPDYAAALLPAAGTHRRPEDLEVEAFCQVARTLLMPERCRGDAKLGLCHALPQQALAAFARMPAARRRRLPKRARALQRLRTRRRRVEAQLERVCAREERAWDRLLCGGGEEEA